METTDNTLVIFMTPKEITSKKDGKKYTIFEGKLRCEGKDFDVTLFEGVSSKGAKYMRGTVKPPYKPSGEPLKDEQGRTIPF